MELAATGRMVYVGSSLCAFGALVYELCALADQHRAAEPATR
jgi:hypothetical protein